MGANGPQGGKAKPFDVLRAWLFANYTVTFRESCILLLILNYTNKNIALLTLSVKCSLVLWFLSTDQSHGVQMDLNIKLPVVVGVSINV